MVVVMSPDAGLPVLLKRGTSSTIEEWLMAAEYIARRGNLDIVLRDPAQAVRRLPALLGRRPAASA